MMVGKESLGGKVTIRLLSCLVSSTIVRVFYFHTTIEPWTQPAQVENPPLDDSRYTRIIFDEFALHKLRTFVVVEERPKQGFSYCW